jgi:pyruvate carboxylase
MKRALGDFALLGVRNNIEFLHRIISADDFAAGRTATSFLDRHPELFNKQKDVPVEAFLVGSVLTAEAQRRSSSASLRSNPGPWNSGAWRNS